jgi:hypothetical protein
MKLIFQLSLIISHAVELHSVHPEHGLIQFYTRMQRKAAFVNVSITKEVNNPVVIIIVEVSILQTVTYDTSHKLPVSLTHVIAGFAVKLLVNELITYFIYLSFV